ncbi:hypothetical protein CDL12_24155 [Handroanthus impetiginosus]|uniref:Reticulon-like protein n=1 Tax=Handroanthus impetiginosus TaxID=429701 RepID=A0A2G9GDF2_9LAMI|nr:hypothetical protein CDL12_24155 [Handroanthus impetiginosus]
MGTKEAMDLGGGRRRGCGPKAGSVWETRMKLDEVKGGIKPFIATSEEDAVNNPEVQVDKKVSPKQSPIGGSGKRKTWKSESPVKIVRQLSKDLDEEAKELSDGVKKSPNTIKKTRSVLSQKGTRKVKSDCNEVINDSKSEDNEVVPDGKIKKVDDEPSNELEGCDKSRSDEDCEDKVITTSLDDDEEINEVEKKSVDVKEINVEEQKPKKIVINEKKQLISCEKSVPISPIVKSEPSPAVNYARFHDSTKTKPNSDHFHGFSRTNIKLQSFVDLIMWRDVSKSAFVFGIGTFAIISSSYTKDLNISFISVVSYLGLVYLAANFLFRSLISRGSMERGNDQDYVVGEEEAIWIVKLILPYINEFLLKLRALFSGDPATTMKLAVLLFILARCGSSITIWKMAKLGFIGVFTVPKICSTYSSQLIAYGTFWIRRFRDAWDSCSHKKAVGFAIFTLVWNLSSIVARIWAVFMLFAAFKYYQQSLMKEGLAHDEIGSTQNSAETIKGQTLCRSTLTELRKQKKVC